MNLRMNLTAFDKSSLITWGIIALAHATGFIS